MTIRFSLREHTRNASYPAVVTFSKPSGSVVRGYSNVGGLSLVWLFFVVPRMWIHGKYIRLRWGASVGYSNWGTSIRIYDGSYNRSSDADFIYGNGLAVKGNGLLQSYLSHTGSFAYTIQEQLVDVSGGSEDYVTIFILSSDSWAAYSGSVDVDWFEVNGGAGGAEGLAREDFDDGIVMEQTGTSKDYGYISYGEAAPVMLNLAASFEVGQGKTDLSAEFVVAQDIQNLLSKFITRFADNQVLSGEFNAAALNEELLGGFIVRHSVSLNLPAKFTPRRSAQGDLKTGFWVNWYSVNLPGKIYIRPMTGSKATDFEVKDNTRGLTLYDADRIMTVTPRRKMRVK